MNRSRSKALLFLISLFTTITPPVHAVAIADLEKNLETVKQLEQQVQSLETQTQQAETRLSQVQESLALAEKRLDGLMSLALLNNTVIFGAGVLVGWLISLVPSFLKKARKKPKKKTRTRQNLIERKVPVEIPPAS